MEYFVVKGARLLSKLPIRSSTQRRAFQSYPVERASTTNTTATTTTTRQSFPRSETAALLNLDTPSTSDLDTARERDRLRISPERLKATKSFKEQNAQIQKENTTLQRLMTRKWQAGDVYTPHDLTPREILKFTRQTRPSKDIFDALGIDPMDSYKNPVFLAEFMTSGGRIKHPRETGLRPVNQRRLARAIRRAVAMGIIPRVHAHPEMLRRDGPDIASRVYKWK